MVIREYLKRYNADEILFYLAVITKPLYLLSSGSFQIGDFLFISAVVIHFLAGSERDLLFPIHREEHSLLIFVIGVLMINVAYWILIGSTDFLLNSSYYIFNFLIVLYAADVIQSDRKDTFLLGLCNSCKIVMIFQILVYISGKGIAQADGRYTGTFNDPNQYSVYILFCLFIMLDVYHEMNLESVVWLVIGSLLIIPSGSTGSLMGIGIFVFLFLILSLATINKKKFKIGIAGAAILIITVCIIQSTKATGIDFVEMMGKRLEGKLKNASSFKDMMNFLINDRIWSRVFEQPKYLLYGSGEGAHIRFDNRGVIYHEIHSSILGPLFYYGIGITCFMFRWIYLKLKNIDAFQFCVYAAMIAESVFLVNYRQPLFWFLFVLAGRQKSYEKSVISTEDKPKHIDSIIIQKIDQ